MNDAIAYVSQKAVELGELEADPNYKGINIVLLKDIQKQLKSADSPQITLTVRNMPLGAVLTYISQMAGAVIDIQLNAVVIGTEDEILRLRNTMRIKVQKERPLRAYGYRDDAKQDRKHKD